MRRLTHMTPISWGAECSMYMQWAYKVIDMIQLAVTATDWSLVDCQEYIVDLEMSVTKAVAALEVASPDQLRVDQAETIQKLESQATIARGLALDLRQKYLECQLNPAATSTPDDRSMSSKKGKPGMLRLDVTLAAERGRIMGEPARGCSGEILEEEEISLGRARP
jgi:hypothetical protein